MDDFRFYKVCSFISLEQTLLLFDDYQGAKVYLLKIYRFRKPDPIKEKATRDLADGENNRT